MRKYPVILITALLLLATSCATTGQHEKRGLNGPYATSFEGVTADDGDWFLLGSHVLRLVYPLSQEKPELAAGHVEAMRDILARNGIQESASGVLHGITAGINGRGKVPVTDAMTAFNDKMTKTLIPTERGVVFYVLGIAAGGLFVHTSLDSREAMENIVASLDDVIAMAPMVEGLPPAFDAITTGMRSRILDKVPHPELLDYLDALFNDMPRSEATRD